MATKDLEAKIVVLGASGVGKTALLTRFTQNTFLPPSQQPATMGATFLTKHLVSPEHSDTHVRLQIWDTAGQERFRSLTRLYYRGANAAILCYDITDERSFIDLQSWVEELRHNMPPSEVDGAGGWGECIVHVVGTKSDMVAENPGSRQIPFERCVDYVTEQLYSQQQLQDVSGQVPSTSHQRPSSAHRSSTPVSVTGWNGPSTIRFDDSVAAASRRRAGTGVSEGRRNSGLWSASAEAGWDSCHEISSKDGEGVEEVFRVIVAKLVEQRNRRERLKWERETGLSKSWSMESGARSGGLDSGDESEGGRLGKKASFRLSGLAGERRLSWLTISRSSSQAVGDDVGPNEGGRRKDQAAGGCC